MCFKKDLSILNFLIHFVNDDVNSTINLNYYDFPLYFRSLLDGNFVETIDYEPEPEPHHEPESEFEPEPEESEPEPESESISEPESSPESDSDSEPESEESETEPEPESESTPEPESESESESEYISQYTYKIKSIFLLGGNFNNLFLLEYGGENLAVKTIFEDALRSYFEIFINEFKIISYKFNNLQINYQLGVIRL